MTSPAVAQAARGGATRFTALQWRVVSLCAAVAFLDGFDTQAIGPAGKAIAATLGLPLGALGPVFSASQIGFLLGALGFGALGDRFGRKRLLVVATALFGLCALGTALAPSYGALFVFRLLAGVGLGGATPNFVSLASEYAPPAQRARTVTTLWAAVPLGGMAAAFASSVTLPLLGWRFLFYVGCAAPLLLVPVLLSTMPESRETLGEAAPRAAVADLFTGGRAPLTVWLWLASFMTWTTLIVMAFWTPPLLQRAGWSASAAATVLAINNAGGVVGTILLGATLTRVRPHHALMLTLLAAAGFLALMGASTGSFAGLAAAAAFAGFFASASGGALLAVSAAAYPAEARATGVGWALGFGRIGAVVGPMAAGLLVTLQWPVPRLYLAIAAPALAAAGLVFLLSRSPAFARSGAASTPPTLH